MILRECSRSLILFLLLLLTVVEAQDPCIIPDNYTILPPNDTYALPGDQFVIKVEHRSMLAPSALTNLTDSEMACNDETASTCILDVNQGLLNITDFQPHFAGSYRFVISHGFGQDDVCLVNFNLHEAIPPTITEDNLVVMLSSDQGLMLMPTVTHGLPPGVVRWYKDGVFLLEGDTYEVLPLAQASDRGEYTATITQSTVNANTSISVMYNVLIDFAPQVQLSESVNNGQIELRCDAVGHPIISSIVMAHIVDGVSQPIIPNVNINNQIEDDNSYTAFATFTIPEATCMNQQYTCSVRNTVSTVQKTINICETVPTIDGLQVDYAATTNVSIGLSWTIIPQGTSVQMYTAYLMEVDNEASLRNFTFSTNTLTYNIPDLSPGVMYSIRLRAMNSDGYGDYSETLMGRPYTVPVGRPKSVDIRSDSRQHMFLQWDEVESLDYAPVTSYDVIYHTSNNSSPVVIGGILEPRYNLSTLGAALDVVYFFKIRAANEWGFGSESAEVQFRYQIIDPRVRVNLTLLEPVVTNTMVTLRWRLSDESEVDYILIEIDRIFVGSAQNDPVTLIPVHQRNATNTNTQCFFNLNRSDIYRFCVIAVLHSGERVTSCKQVTTGQNSPDGSSDNCVPVEPLVSDGGSVIPSWVIAVSVVACVLLVVIVFGGCGLYFGLKRTRKGEANFDSPNQSFDKIPQPTNGYPSYPPAPPAHRPVSPGSSCMICKSNRHNNHAHQMDWRVTNPVETTVV